MEYKLFYFLRNNSTTPYLVRLFLAAMLILVSIIPIILPVFPGSLFAGIFILVFGLLLVVPSKKVKHVIKMRKSIFYLFSNLHKKRTIWQKIYDIKRHVKKIIHDKQIKRKQNIISKHRQKLVNLKRKLILKK